MGYVDLHLHTNFSDGADAPEMVVARAEGFGYSAIAITDHDTIDAVAPARKAAEASGMAYLDGVEISASYAGREVHVLGYGLRPAGEGLLRLLAWLREGRRFRAERVVERLRAQGIDVTLSEGDARGENPARMQIAQALVAAKVVRAPQQAFDRYLNAGKPAYVPKLLAPVEEALEALHASGWLAFVAHPGLSRGLRRLLPRLLALPFDGIEAYHVSHSPGRVTELIELAAARHLLVCGGSDCHGAAKDRATMGLVQTPDMYFEQIQAVLSAN